MATNECVRYVYFNLSRRTAGCRSRSSIDPARKRARAISSGFIETRAGIWGMYTMNYNRIIMNDYKNVEYN